MTSRGFSGPLARRVIGVGGKVIRYGMAAVGPIGVAGSQFLLSVQLLHTLPAAAFGSFSFLLVASQLSTSIWAALFAAPMPILLATDDEDLKISRRRSLMAANLAGALVAGPLFAGIAFFLHAPPLAAGLFGAYAAANLVRWFGRAYAYSQSEQWRTMASDILYGAVLLVGIGMAFLHPFGSLSGPYAALLLAALFGLVPFGLTFLKQQFTQISPHDLGGYVPVWREHSGWSLTGVITTEATGNGHAYIVTLLSGANAFAPLAASALLMRPISVASNALTDFERPQMARLIAGGKYHEADRAAVFFLLILMLAWVGTVALAIALMRFAPGALFPPEYDRRQLMIGTALWLTVAFVRLMRTPVSVLLQAGGQFRPLAQASMISSGVSLVAVPVLLLTAGPVWSIAGVLMGEVVFAIWTWRQKARWKAEGEPSDNGDDLRAEAEIAPGSNV